jgi:hypothetical protein
MREKLLGAWGLVSFSVATPEGNVSYPFGRDAFGTLMYDASGRMTAQLGRRDRPKFVSGDQQKVTDEEARLAVQGYVAYFGTFEVRESEGVVVHKVIGSLFPNWNGTGQVRHVKLEGDKLTIEVSPSRWGGPGATTRLVWRRV